MLMRFAAAVAVEYLLPAGVKQPVVIISKQFPRMPGMPFGLVACGIRRPGDKRLFYKNIDGIDAILRCVLLQAVAELLSL